MKNTSWRNPLLLFLTAAIWGTAFVAQSVGMDYIGPFTFNFARCIIGSIVLIPCIFLLDRVRGRAEDSVQNSDGKNQASSQGRKGEARASVQNSGGGASVYTWRQKELYIGGFWCGLALFVASNLQQFGIKYTTVGKAGFITALYIVIVPVLGIFLKKKVGMKVWGSVVLAVIGLYLLCMTGGLSIGLGDFLVLLCAAVFSIHILVIDYFSPKVDGVRMSCIQFLVCGILSAVGILLTENFDWGAIMEAWVPVLYAGVMSCGVAYTLQIVGQKDMDPTIASLILSLESVVSVLAGWVLLNQKLSVRELSGCVLMFVAIILAQLPERRSKAGDTGADKNGKGK